MREKLIELVTHIETLFLCSGFDWTIAYDPETRYYHFKVGVKEEE